MEASEVFASVRPFTGLPEVQAEVPAVMTESTVQREIAEVQASMAVAKKFPRNQMKALDRILTACQRPTLAEVALYSYARGGTPITGPSIRLAEAIVQQWGNIDFGIRELDQRIGESTVQAYAWDLETNTRQTKTFQVKHRRHTKKGGYNLEDPRDIYEMVANQGARRLRACILGVIPGDVVEAAVNQCEETLKAKADVSPEAIKKMVDVFGSYGVTQPMIEAKIQRKLISITAAQVISLRKIFNSLKDGMSKPEDWFDMEAAPDKPKRNKKTASPDPASEPITPKPEQSTIPQSDNATSAASVGPRAVTDKLLELIQNNIKRTGYELEILLQDYEITALTELTEAAGENMLKFLIALPDIN